MEIIKPSLLTKLLDLQPCGTIIYDSHGQCLYCNKYAYTYQNLTEEAFKSTSIFNLFSENLTLKSQLQQLITGELARVQFETANNTRFFNVSLSIVDEYIVASLTETTEQHDLTLQLDESNQNVKRLEDALIGANIGCWDYLPKQGTIIANKTWVTQKKYEDTLLRKGDGLFSEIIDGLEKWSKIVHPDDLGPTLDTIQEHLDGKTDIYDAKFRMKCGDGKWRWIHDRGRVFERDDDGSPIRMNGVHIDITESKHLESRILELLNIDFLTKVNSRRSFEEHVNQALKQCNRDNSYLAFLILDIDHFKLFNDTYGHLEGDRSLMAVGDVINKSLKRGGDTCFRLGGEEFAIIYQVDSKQTALKLAHTIKDSIESLKIPHKYNTASPYLTVSMGLWCDKTNENIVIDDMYSRADALLYQAKSSGRNRIKF